MPDYKTMYLKLFNAITDVVEILQDAQRKTEEIYITSSEQDEGKIKYFKIIEKEKKE